LRGSFRAETRSARWEMHRRPLKFENLDDAVEECRQLQRSGYLRAGNWSLGQACRHLRLAQDSCIDGYPRWMSLFAPLRPLLRWFFLPRLLRGDSPAGIRTAGNYVPPPDVDDEQEFRAFAECVRRFADHDGFLYPHPGFGKFDHSALGQFHAAHAAHHFGFLIPNRRTDFSPLPSGSVRTK
jgi:hypothetical protein